MRKAVLGEGHDRLDVRTEEFQKRSSDFVVKEWFDVKGEIYSSFRNFTNNVDQVQALGIPVGVALGNDGKMDLPKGVSADLADVFKINRLAVGIRNNATVSGAVDSLGTTGISSRNDDELYEKN